MLFYVILFLVANNISFSLPLAVTGSLDKTAKVWDLGTMQCRVTLPHEVRAIYY